MFCTYRKVLYWIYFYGAPMNLYTEEADYVTDGHYVKVCQKGGGHYFPRAQRCLWHLFKKLCTAVRSEALAAKTERPYSILGGTIALKTLI